MPSLFLIRPEEFVYTLPEFVWLNFEERIDQKVVVGTVTSTSHFGDFSSQSYTAILRCYGSRCFILEGLEIFQTVPCPLHRHIAGGPGQGTNYRDDPFEQFASFELEVELDADL